MNKEKVIFFSVIGLVLILTVIYTLSITGKSKTASKEDFTIPELVDKNKSKEEYLSRLANAKSYQEPAEEVPLDKKMDFKTYTNEEKQPPKASSSSRKASSSSSTRSVQRETAVGGTATAKVVTIYDTVKVSEPKPKRNNFGVVTNSQAGTKQQVASNTVEPKTETNSIDFIPVMLEESATVRDGSTVVFISREDFLLDGTTIRKNSYIYCTASTGKDRFNLKAIKILNQGDGEIYRPNNFFIYDEKYIKGLEVEGKLNNALNESTGEVARESELGTYSGNVSIDASLNLLKKTIQKSGKNEITISLEKGYKVYLKKEE